MEWYQEYFQFWFHLEELVQVLCEVDFLHLQNCKDLPWVLLCTFLQVKIKRWNWGSVDDFRKPWLTMILPRNHIIMWGMHHIIFHYLLTIRIHRINMRLGIVHMRVFMNICTLCHIIGMLSQIIIGMRRLYVMLRHSFTIMHVWIIMIIVWAFIGNVSVFISIVWWLIFNIPKTKTFKSDGWITKSRVGTYGELWTPCIASWAAMSVELNRTPKNQTRIQLAEQRAGWE